MTFPTAFGLPRFALLAATLALAGCGKAANPPAAAAPTSDGRPLPTHAVIETSLGEIEIEFFREDSPKAVDNFRLLAERDYYKDVIFHRIIKNFMVQGGDPQGTGMGGQSAWGGTFEDNINRTSPLYRANYQRGIVAMANSGPNTNTSQFFILHKYYPLPPNYLIFAKVVRGMEVVDAMTELPMKRGMDGQMSSPIMPPVIKKVTVKTVAATSEKK